MAISQISIPRGLRAIVLPISFITLVFMLVTLYRSSESNGDFLKGLTTINGGNNNLDTTHDRPANTHAPPKYKPTPTYVAASVEDPFPLLASSTATPPPVPEYNIPRTGLHREYGLSYVPPLFIGFTRQWPMLLQCVVGYITAGWPPESIYVVENTGVQDSNTEGKLSLQNPFYLNHTTLDKLGVNVLQTPVLLTFSQMQNFFLSTAHARSWPYYFYSHQDVLVFSFEDGPDIMKRPGDRDWFFYDKQDEADTMRPPAAGQEGYRTIYENCLRELNETAERAERWAFRWFQYDHLTLVNREALDAVGGWDSLMPYYGSDCDMNARLEMDGWTMRHRRVGIINDVSTVMEDLAALYRDPKVTAKFVDPNPVADEELETLESPKQDDAKEKDPSKETEPSKEKEPSKEDKSAEEGEPTEGEPSKEKEVPKEQQDGQKPRHKRGGKVNGDKGIGVPKAVEYFRELLKVADEMGAYKYRNENQARNSWQNSQHGGVGEPYYYNSDGFAASFWILAEAGREVFRQKWGHRDCDLVQETALQLDDQWRVEQDWED